MMPAVGFNSALRACGVMLGGWLLIAAFAVFSPARMPDSEFAALLLAATAIVAASSIAIVSVFQSQCGGGYRLQIIATHCLAALSLRECVKLQNVAAGILGLAIAFGPAVLLTISLKYQPQRASRAPQQSVWYGLLLAGALAVNAVTLQRLNFPVTGVVAAVAGIAALAGAIVNGIAPQGPPRVGAGNRAAPEKPVPPDQASFTVHEPTSGDVAAAQSVELSMESVRALIEAFRAAGISGSPDIDTVHLVLAVIWQRSAGASALFQRLVTPVGELAAALDAALPVPLNAWEADPDLWRNAVRPPLEDAQHWLKHSAGLEAQRCGAGRVMPVHILVAAMAEPGAASLVLQQYLPTIDEVRALVCELSGSSGAAT